MKKKIEASLVDGKPCRFSYNDVNMRMNVVSVNIIIKKSLHRKRAAEVRGRLLLLLCLSSSHSMFQIQVHLPKREFDSVGHVTRNVSRASIQVFSHFFALLFKQIE